MFYARYLEKEECVMGKKSLFPNKANRIVVFVATVLLGCEAESPDFVNRTQVQGEEIYKDQRDTSEPKFLDATAVKAPKAKSPAPTLSWEGPSFILAESGNLVTFKIGPRESTEGVAYICADNCPSNLNVADDGTIIWQTLAGDTGLFEPTFHIEREDLRATGKVKIFVVGKDLDIVAQDLGTFTAKEGHTFSAQISTYDPEGKSLSYSCETNCIEKLAIDAEGKIAWTPTYDEAGDYKSTIIVSDGSQAVPLSFSVTVENTNRAPTLTELAPIKGKEGASLTFMLLAADADKDPLKYSCENYCPEGLKVDSFGAVTWTPSYQQAGTYSPEFMVSDGELSAVRSSTLIIDATNRAPTIAARKVPAKEGVMMQGKIDAIDLDGDALAYACETTCLPGLTLDPASGSFSYNPSQSAAGKHMQTITVSDGTTTTKASFEFIVERVNLLPSIAEITPKLTKELQTLTFVLNGTDPDGDTLMYSCIDNCPKGLSTEAGSGKVSWNPNSDQQGNYKVTFQASDGSLNARTIADISVIQVNIAPTLNPVASKITPEMKKLEFTLMGTDVDKDSLTYSCVNCPAGMAIQAQTGQVAWTPTHMQAGVYPIQFQVTDGQAKASQQTSITVTQVNQAPKVSPTPTITVSENETVTTPIIASDLDKDPLQYKCVSGCIANLSIHPSSGIITASPDYTQAGDYTIGFEVTDGMLTTAGSAKLSVTPENAPPKFQPVNDQTAEESSELKFTLKATDVDGDKLSYQCIEACPPGLTVIAGSGAVSWKTGYQDAGQYFPKFRVFDGALTDELAVSLRVTNGNAPPTLSVGPLAVVETETLAAQLLGVDIDNDPLTYKCESGCPTGFGVEATTGKISYTPGYSAAGSYPIVFSINDAVYTTTFAATLTVQEKNAPPALADIVSKTVAEQSTLSFTLEGKDVDGQALAYSCLTSCPTGLKVTPNGVVSWTPTYEQEGTYKPVFAVSDGLLQATKEAVILVTHTNAPPTLANIVDKKGVENTPFTFTLSGNDIDKQALTYACISSCPTGLSVNPINGMVSWLPGFEAAGVYNVGFSVTDGTLAANKTAKITIQEANAPPTFSTIPNQSISENKNLVFVLNATDLDNDPLTFSCTANCPPGLKVDPKGSASWTPNYTQEGVYKPTFTVTDGVYTSTQLAQITVLHANAPPTLDAITDKTALENKAFSFTLVGKDIDKQTLTYACITNCPTGLTVNPTSGVISWLPGYEAAGVYNVSFSVSDGSLTASRAAKITVQETNAPPTFSAIPNQTVLENQNLVFVLAASDLDKDPLAFICTKNCPSGLQVDPKGNVSWKPTYTQKGVYKPTFSVTDGTYTVTQLTQITVQDANAPPDLAVIAKQSVLEDTTLSFDLKATDLDATPLEYSCSANCPIGLTTNKVTGTVTWKPGFSDAATYQVEFQVTDGTLIDKEIATIVVQEKNAAPTFNAAAKILGEENRLLNFALSAKDIDLDALSYACLSACPAGLSTAPSGTVNWTPTYEQEGTYLVTFEVSDGILTDTQVVTIEIKHRNAPPTLNVIAAQQGTEGALLTFDLSGTDIDSDPLTYSCITDCPTGLSVSGYKVNWTPGLSASGSYQVEFQVSDGEFSAVRTANIQILNKNQTPSFTSISNLKVKEGELLLHTLTATDPDGDVLRFACLQNCPVGLNVNAALGTLQWTPGQTAVGTYTPTVEVRDANTASTQLLTIIVEKVNVPPVLDAPGQHQVKEGETLAFTLYASDEDQDTLTYTCSSQCETGLKLNPTTGLVEWTPGFSASGVYSIQFTVSDGLATDSKSVDITVNQVNQAPIFAQPSSQMVRENQLLELTLSAIDPDGDDVTYHCIGNCPAGLIVDSDSGLLSWRPDYDSAGTYSKILLEARDPSSSTTRNLTIMVEDVALDTLRSRFSAVTTSPTSFTLPLNSSFVTQEITLARTSMNETMNFKQIVRPEVTEMKVQGNSGSTKTETFSQVGKGGLLDILIVIDNSSSMAEEQNNLATKLDPLLSNIADADWRIGVTTTDPADPCIRGLISKNDPNYQTAFQTAIQAGEGGSNTEMGIRMAVEGLKCSSPNWIREDSTIAVLIVSDEDNCGTKGILCKNDPWTSEDYLIDHLNSIRTVGTDARVYGLFWHPNTPSSACKEAAFRAHVYADAVSNSGGTSGSICDGDYSSTLQAISSNISTILKDQFNLAHTPVPGTLEVRVDGSLMTSGYTLTGKVVEFSVAPSVSSSIAFTYSHDPVARFSEIILSEPAVAASISVSENGVEMPSSQYQFSAAQNKIIFSPIPADHSQVQVQFKKDMPLKTAFELGADIQANSLLVTVDGVSVSGSFSPSTGTYSIVPAPIDGASISADFTRWGKAQLTYNVNFPAGTASEDILVTDTTTGETVGFSHGAHSISIDPAGFQEGKKVNIEYFDPGLTLDSAELPSIPFENTLTIQKGTVFCENPDYQINLSGKTVDLSQCTIDRNLTDLLFEYENLVTHHQSFEVSTANSIPGNKRKIWRVFIDSQETTQFSVAGNTVTLDFLPDKLSTIDVELTYEK